MWIVLHVYTCRISSGLGDSQTVSAGHLGTGIVQMTHPLESASLLCRLRRCARYI